jgi:hypothetical protein
VRLRPKVALKIFSILPHSKVKHNKIFTNNQAQEPQRTLKQKTCDSIDINVSLIVLNHLNIFDIFELVAVPKTNFLQKPFRFFFLFACEERTTTW